MRHLFFVAALTAIVASASAAIKPHCTFTDNAVLQRGVPLPITGTANDGEQVTVIFQKQKVSTVAKDGKWKITLKPLEAGGPFEMTISTTVLKNILVGDVWVCSGQYGIPTQQRAQRRRRNPEGEPSENSSLFRST
jgi:sialate O-acetylesterase